MKPSEEVLAAYLKAIDFTLDDEDRGAKMADETAQRCVTDCAEFFEKAEAIITSCGPDVFMYPWIQAGYDFWMTRAGHGVGFWDGDWPEPQASQLTDLCYEFGNLETYTGDDGLLYFI